jgi:hypothetical protein
MVFNVFYMKPCHIDSKHSWDSQLPKWNPFGLFEIHFPTFVKVSLSPVETLSQPTLALA